MLPRTGAILLTTDPDSSPPLLRSFRRSVSHRTQVGNGENGVMVRIWWEWWVKVDMVGNSGQRRVMICNGGYWGVVAGGVGHGGCDKGWWEWQVWEWWVVVLNFGWECWAMGD